MTGGLSDAEAARLLEARGPVEQRSSRSTASIVLANTITPFNAILTALGVLTLLFGDWRDALFLGIIVSNSAIGIAQELSAKRKLDALAALVAPTARVVRSGTAREVHAEDVVVGDLIRLRPGDQVVADGLLTEADALLLDEAILTGESEPIRREAGDTVLSGTFVVEGAAEYLARAVGEDSYAERITGEAREFRHPRSPLERSLNRLLFILVGFMVPVGTMFIVALAKQDVSMDRAVTQAVAGLVTLVPEGLVLLASITFATAAVRMARRGALAQQLNAIESLASVDTICIDKTGTLTEPRLDVRELVPAPGVSRDELAAAFAAYAAAAPAHNATLEAIASAFPREPLEPAWSIPFSSRTRWSAVGLDGKGYILGAPEVVGAAALAGRAVQEQEGGRRVVALGATPAPFDKGADEPPPSSPLGLAVIAEELRPGIRDTIRFLADEGVTVIVLSGDDPRTVSSIARDAGIPVFDPLTGAELPGDDTLADAVSAHGVVGRIDPEGKRRVVRALKARGKYVAMVGDGVNDVPALKEARLAIAQGSGTQMAKAVADVVLVEGDFAAVPPMIAEGRKILRNIQRVTKLYVTKSAFAAFLILSIGLTREEYPLLPRHLTLAGALAIGVPTFFLALAPSTGPWTTHRFLRNVASFAVPAGVACGLGVLASFLIEQNVFSGSTIEAQTVATSVLVLCGLYFIVVLEATGVRRGAWVLTLVGSLFAAYIAALLLPATRTFFELVIPGLSELVAIAIGLTIAIGFLLMTDPRFLPPHGRAASRRSRSPAS